MNTRLHEREPQVIARDTLHVVVGLTDEAYTTVRTAAERVASLRDPEAVKALPRETEEQVRARVDQRVAALESTFDDKAAAGAEVIARIRRTDRVAHVEETFAPVGDQAKIARSQVKGAVTSLRGTFDAALGAGRAQADTARSQVKGAVTSSRKTVGTAFAAGRRVAS